MNLEKERTRREIEDAIGLEIVENFDPEVREGQPRYPFEESRCINVITDINGSRVCNNLLSRYNPYNVCEACKVELKGDLERSYWARFSRFSGKRRKRRYTQIKH